MSRSNSVLNFREIIINGIQDLESGVKKKNSGRDSSAKLRDSPSLPQFAIGENSSTTQQQSINGQVSKSIFENNSQLSHIDSQYIENIEIQQFKKPTFINPVKLNQIKQSKGEISLNLNQNEISRSNQNQSLQQKDSLDQEGECTFREYTQQDGSKPYLKWINSPIIENNYIQSNTKNSGHQFYNTIQDESQTQKYNANFSEQQNNHDKDQNQSKIGRFTGEQSVQSYSLLNSRMEKREDERERFYARDISSSVYEKQNGNSRNQYFCIYDDPNKDREQIIKTLSQYQKEILNGSNSISDNKQKKMLHHDSIKFKNSQNSNNMQNFEESRQGSSKMKMDSSQPSIRMNDKKSTVKRSSSYKKEVSFSPQKNSTLTPLKKNKIKDRFPSQNHLAKTLRSQSSNNMLQTQSNDYIINKTNLKKMILHFESEKVRGLYNLTSFIKLFREFGLMQAKNSDKFMIQKEIQFVEELWRLLKFSSYSAECVGTGFIYQILLIVIDSSIHQLDQAANLIDVLCKREYEKYSGFFEKQREECQIWQSLVIVEGIRSSLQYIERNEKIFELNEQLQKQVTTIKKTSYDKLFDHTKYLKSDLNQNTPLKERNTLKEKINQIENTHNKFKVSSIQKNDNDENNSENIILKSTQKQQQNHLQQVNYVMENSNQTNNLHNGDLQATLLNVKSKKSFDQSEYQRQDNVHNRLYQSSFKQIQTTSTNHLIKEQEEQEKLQECTFKPKINKNTDKILQKSISNTRIPNNYCGQQTQTSEQTIQQQIRGVKQNLQRMEQARQQKQYKEQFWENQRIRYSNTRSRSPGLQNGQLKDIKAINNRSPSPNQNVIRETVKKEKPMLYVDINISKGKSGKIAFYQGDQPEQVAENFAKIYNISESAKQKLINNLKNILQEYYTQLYERF